MRSPHRSSSMRRSRFLLESCGSGDGNIVARRSSGRPMRAGRRLLIPVLIVGGWGNSLEESLFPAGGRLVHDLEPVIVIFANAGIHACCATESPAPRLSSRPAHANESRNRRRLASYRTCDPAGDPRRFLSLSPCGRGLTNIASLGTGGSLLPLLSFPD